MVEEVKENVLTLPDGGTWKFLKPTLEEKVVQGKVANFLCIFNIKIKSN